MFNQIFIDNLQNSSNYNSRYEAEKHYVCKVIMYNYSA